MFFCHPLFLENYQKGQKQQAMMVCHLIHDKQEFSHQDAFFMLAGTVCQLFLISQFYFNIILNYFALDMLILNSLHGFKSLHDFLCSKLVSSAVGR